MLIAAIALIGLSWWAGGRSSAAEQPPDSPVVLTVDDSESRVHSTAVPTTRDHQREIDQDASVARSDQARASQATDSEGVRPVGWYQLAALEYGVSPQLLEALHHVESNASGDSCIANLEGSGATGPFQFKLATFTRFGVDANQDGIVDICGFSDSLFSAAHYLQTIGADADPASEASRRALARYGTDVERVTSLALAYLDRDRN